MRITAAIALALLVSAQARADCRCLASGGQPGPGECPCDVTQCYQACVAELCPWTACCTLECSRRCSCNDAPPGCPSHEDPGPTPTPVPAQQTHAVTACYSEVPNSYCSPFGVPYEAPSLFGPIPYGTMHTATPDPSRPSSYTLSNLPPGNYILGAGV